MGSNTGEDAEGVLPPPPSTRSRELPQVIEGSEPCQPEVNVIMSHANVPLIYLTKVPFVGLNLVKSQPLKAGGFL